MTVALIRPMYDVVVENQTHERREVRVSRMPLWEGHQHVSVIEVRGRQETRSNLGMISDLVS